MALKPDRIELPVGSRIKYFMNEVAERGVVVVYDSTSGNGLDDPDAAVVLPAAATGEVAAGVLMNDVVNLDLTRIHRNQHKDETQIGDKVALLTRGYIKTNMLVSGDTPSAGDPAHYATDGLFTTTTTSDQVGRFVSDKDAEGYAEIEVNIN